MSASRPTQTTQVPWKKKYRWSSKEKMWRYWNFEEKKNEFVNTLAGIILEVDVNSITGFNNANNCGYYSNMFRDENDHVKIHLNKTGHVYIQGCYIDIKDSLKAEKAHFTKNLFLYSTGGELVLVELERSSLGAWIDMVKASPYKERELPLKVFYTSGKYETKQKGDVTWNVPEMFVTSKVADEAAFKTNKAKAIEADEVLQTYLDLKISARPDDSYVADEETAPPLTEDDAPVIQGEEDLPF